jgi:iron complex outermembrane receptor protein
MLQAQQCNDLTLRKADQDYRIGDFESVIKLLDKCLEPGGFETDEQRFSGHKILANVYLLTDYFELAEKEVESLLVYNPAYSPNKIDESLQFIELVDRIRGEKIHNNDAYVVSASKRKQRASDAPATVHVINYEQIQARGYTSLLDLLEDIPSVEIQRNSINEFKNAAGIRGILGNEKFMIMMDGIRITPATGDPYALNHNFSLINAERVEVILGPASALYGVDAFSGIINIITKEGNDINGGTINSSFGQYNTNDQSFIAGTKSNGIDISVSGQRYISAEPDYQNLYPEEYAWYNDVYKTTGMMGNPFFSGDTLPTPNNYNRSFQMPTETNFLSANLRLGDFKVGASYNDTKHCPAVSNDPRAAVYTDEAFLKTSMQTAYFQHVLLKELRNRSQSFSLQSTLSYSNFQMDTESNFVNFYTGYNHGYKYLYSKSTKIEEQFEYVFNTKHSLIAGASYELLGALPKSSDIETPVDKKIPTDNQNLYYSGSILEGDTVGIPLDFYYLNYSNYGAYAQWQWKPNRKLEFTVGGRFDNNSRFDRSINPRFGVVIKPTNRLKIKLLGGSAFLAPSPWKAYLSYGSFVETTDENGNPALKADFFHLPNPDLKPEKLSSSEFSVIWLPNDNMKFSVGGYFNSIDQLISLQEYDYTQNQFKNIPIGLVETTQNQGKAQTWGFNFNAYSSLIKTESMLLNWYGSYDYSDGYIEVSQSDGTLLQRDLPANAKHTIKSGFDYNWDRLTASLRVLYRSKSKSVKTLRPDPNPVMDASNNEDKHTAFAVLNLHARYVLLDKNRNSLATFIKISNLLNTRYYNVAAATDSFSATPQDPRRFSFGISLNF